MKREEVLKLLENADIAYELAEHPAVYTMEEMHRLNLPKESSVARNLFLRDDKKRNYYLVVMHPEHETDLKTLRAIIGSRPLSFASEADLMKYLKLEKGSVTPLGVLNDTEHKVSVRIDDAFRGEEIGIHPDTNTATLWLMCDQLKEFLGQNGTDTEYIAIKNGQE